MQVAIRLSGSFLTNCTYGLVRQEPSRPFLKDKFSSSLDKKLPLLQQILTLSSRFIKLNGHRQFPLYALRWQGRPTATFLYYCFSCLVRRGFSGLPL
ncbi:MAG: hypothetical protein ACI8W7_004164 [Gammaproteobacteria bacterium]|jgi:hypothetical protein